MRTIIDVYQKAGEQFLRMSEMGLRRNLQGLAPPRIIGNIADDVTTDLTPEELIAMCSEVPELFTSPIEDDTRRNTAQWIVRENVIEFVVEYLDDLNYELKERLEHESTQAE